MSWAGVDVGGSRKGFHVAVLEGWSLELAHLRAARDVAKWLRERHPQVIGIDSPCRPAEDGQSARVCEKELARSVCGIRWTPAQDKLGNPYYEWVRNGLELYRALEGEATVIEVFPTAAWTRWAGGRGSRSRAQWSSRALARLPVKGAPRRTSQDVRDAIAAAVTARLYAKGKTEAFGDIVVPLTAVALL